MSENEVESQSKAVARHLQATPLVAKLLSSSPEAASAISVYLPMEGGREVNTWLIIEKIAASNWGIAVPRVRTAVFTCGAPHPCLRSFLLPRWNGPRAAASYTTAAAPARAAGFTQVVGKRPEDMKMLAVPAGVALGDLRALPIDAWRIPVPDTAWAEVDDVDVALVLVR